jgi:broad specificity phosphatase PhoE
VAGKIQGKADTPLDEKGELESGQIAERLFQQYPIHCLYASPYQRAQQTASYIARRYQLEIQTDPDLVEVDFGDFSNIRFDELKETHPDLFQRFQSFMLSHPDQGFVRPELPNGESIRDIEARITRLTNRLLDKHHGQSIALVTHGAFLKCLVAFHTGLPLTRRMPFWFENASLSIIDFYQGLPVIRSLNDTGHLGEAIRYFSPRLL